MSFRTWQIRWRRTAAAGRLSIEALQWTPTANSNTDPACARSASPRPASCWLPYTDAVTAARRLIVLRAMEQAGGHQTRAAERLGVTQPYLSRLVKQLGMRRGEP